MLSSGAIRCCQSIFCFFLKAILCTSGPLILCLLHLTHQAPSIIAWPKSLSLVLSRSLGACRTSEELHSRNEVTSRHLLPLLPDSSGHQPNQYL